MRFRQTIATRSAKPTLFVVRVMVYLPPLQTSRLEQQGTLVIFRNITCCKKSTQEDPSKDPFTYTLSL